MLPALDPEAHPQFCDVSLPVPMDQAFTYRLPESMRHRVAVGCRVLVPFGPRQLTGVVIATHRNPTQGKLRDVMRLLDEEPVFDETLLKLGQWIATYYCAPLGETLRAMTPLSSEVRRGKVYALTSAGRDAARQLHLGVAETPDPATAILKLLENRALSGSYVAQKVKDSAAILKSLVKKGLIEVEESAETKDPMRAPAARLRVEFKQRPDASAKRLPKPERELLAYLELHPGQHNVASLDELVPKASIAARALARLDLVHLALEAVELPTAPMREPHPLNSHQQAAFDAIRSAIEAHEFRAFLLEGVTGSGKTEVYMNAIEAVLADGRGALLLVPEIALTPAVAGQFQHRFGEKVAILHSAFGDAERTQEWRRIRAGIAQVVIATRSGVFAPVQNLGLIIVDEEHDNSYKQQDAPRYHGRDVAVVRARDERAVVVLGSATPSLESRYNTERGKYGHLRLPERVQQRPMPLVQLVDMREEFLETRKQNTFSRALIDAVTARLDNGEQAMLLMNRRGFSSFVACRACGQRMECANCSITLTYHRRDRRMLCHLCNYSDRVPSVCAKCESDQIQFLGVGSERVEEELHTAFPRARIARLDRDTVGAKRDFETILGGFRDHKYDLLVGTQMIAKGHDIPNVTLVGIVNADIGLGLPDFRAAERAFQLLTQAAGRAGRGTTPGIVLIQTINPDHYAIQFAARQDYSKFYEKEIDFRRSMTYPPFGSMASIMVRSTNEGDAAAKSEAIGKLLTPAPEGLRVMGPAPASVPRVKTEYRFQLLLKSNSRAKLTAALASVRELALREKWNPTMLAIDVDPMTVL